jgi:trans-2,3-dihydro-3-hydroxyanthranilate isomerase
MSNPKRKWPYVQLDVFTAVPLEGNQLAVFPDATGLSDAEMQAIAREMNLSETTFILPRDAATERERGVRVRIFTVTEELPFAGHPTLGTAMVLRNQMQLRNQSGAEKINLDLNVGKIPVEFTMQDGLPFGRMTQRNPEFLNKHSREEVARAASLALDDIADDVPIQTVSTGNSFAIVPVRSLAVLEKLAPTWTTMAEYLNKSDAKFFYFVSRETRNSAAKLQSRMIFYGGEDPATGSAAGPCAAWAVQYGVIPAEQESLIEQGVEMKRKSSIFITGGRRDNQIVNIRVGGNAVEVLRGELSL